MGDLRMGDWEELCGVLDEHALHHELTGTSPTEGINYLRKSGLLRWQFTARASEVETLTVLDMVTRHDPSFALILAMIFGANRLAGDPGDKLRVIAVSGPDTTSSNLLTAVPTTKAQRNGDTYVLDGIKPFVTGVPVADEVLTSVVNPATGECMLVIVPTNAMGLTITNGFWVPPALSASKTEKMTLHGVRVGAESVLTHMLDGEAFLNAMVANSLPVFGYYTAVLVAQLRYLLRLCDQQPSHKHVAQRFATQVQDMHRGLLAAAEMWDRQLPGEMPETQAGRANQVALLLMQARLKAVTLAKEFPLQALGEVRTYAWRGARAIDGHNPLVNVALGALVMRNMPPDDTACSAFIAQAAAQQPQQ